MIVRRLVLFFAVLCGLATTQLPEFVQQYRQRLGGAVDEIAAIVAHFDAEAQDLGMTQAEAIGRLETNPDRLVEARGRDMEHLIARLAKLRRALAALESSDATVKWGTFLTTFDPAIAARAYEAYQPAVPTTLDGALAGLVGFVFGGALAHLVSLPVRHGSKLFRRRHLAKRADSLG
jgi:non-ribosomal peptide synthetase component F